jgi:DNA-binding transcriptional LysR family regulator
MPEPSLAEISAFVSVLERASFAGAAKQLGLSPPRVSELVRNLEERLRVRLVERTTRSVAATEAGERLLTRLRPVLDEYTAALESISEFRDTPAGRLRITVAPPAADFVISPILPEFLARYPDIALEVSVSGALLDLVASRFDAGIRPGEWLDRDMIAVRVSGPIGFAVMAAPSYLARRGTPKTPQDLIGHNCIRLRLPSGALFPWQFHKDQQTAPDVHADGSLIVEGSITVAVDAAVQGVGLLQYSPNYVAPLLASGALVKVLEDWAPPPMQGFFLYYPSRKQMRPALKALVDFLRENYHRNSGNGGNGNGSSEPGPAKKLRRAVR